MSLDAELPSMEFERGNHKWQLKLNAYIRALVAKRSQF